MWRLLGGLGIMMCLVSNCAAGFLDRWTSHPVVGGPYNAVAFGNDRFIAVGNQSIATSSDGVVWHSAPEPSGTEIKSITFGNGIFGGVTSATTIVNASGYAVRSTNGENWEVINLGFHHLNAVAFGDGLFVAGGMHLVNGTSHLELRASFFRSRDAKVWEEQFLDLPGEIKGVAFENGTFVAVGEIASGIGVIYTSTDGTGWQKQAFNPPSLFSIASGYGLFVAVGNSTQVFVSRDGVSWSAKELSLNAPLNLAAFGNGTFFAGRMYYGDFAGSADGENWTVHKFPDDNAVQSVAFGNGRFVGVSSLGYALTSGNVALPILSLTSDGAGVSIESAGEAGKSYRLEKSADFDAWTVVKEFTNTATTVQIGDTSDSTTAFYRVSKEQ